MRAEHAFLMSSILSDNERAWMFGRNSLLNLPFQVAAKTGTTNDFRDNWTLATPRPGHRGLGGQRRLHADGQHHRSDGRADLVLVHAVCRADRQRRRADTFLDAAGHHADGDLYGLRDGAFAVVPRRSAQ